MSLSLRGADTLAPPLTDRLLLQLLLVVLQLLMLLTFMLVLGAAVDTRLACGRRPPAAAADPAAPA